MSTVTRLRITGVCPGCAETVQLWTPCDRRGPVTIWHEHDGQECKGGCKDPVEPSHRSDRRSDVAS